VFIFYGEREKRRTKTIPPTMASPSHPYHPTGIALSGDLFVPNSSSVSSLVQSFAGVVGALLLLTHLVARRARPDLSFSDQALVLWFVMSK
jgi:cholestenol Delta-isomerase